MQIKYGLIDNNIDVTSICMNKLREGDYIIIPCNDSERAEYFTDPIRNVLKFIFIIDDNGIITEYDTLKVIYINIVYNEVLLNNIPDSIRLFYAKKRLSKIHEKLKLKNNQSFKRELPEQQMVAMYLKGNESVLEIGGNIGRNSLVISSILMRINNKRFVVFECDKNIAKELTENRELNKKKFNIENSALSKRKLIQKGWNTIVSDKLLPGYKNINIITYDEIKKKYNIVFDTLVLDCEGAFYYILIDMPEILENIKLIIMENDYRNIDHKNYIDSILKSNNFYVDYTQSGGWGPCYNNFYEVWKKD